MGTDRLGPICEEIGYYNRPRRTPRLRKLGGWGGGSEDSLSGLAEDTPVPAEERPVKPWNLTGHIKDFGRVSWVPPEVTRVSEDGGG